MEGNSTMKKTKQSGAVSLLVVIFTALLITVVTVGFISLMVRNQKQASDSDMSQSAYDSALAGVEDAKRAILRLENVCKADPTLPACTDLITSLDSGCLTAVNQLKGVGDTSTANEVKIKTSGTDEKLNQAYTCVKVSMNNPDYLGFMDKDSSNLVPLVGEDTFSKVKISWYLPADLDSGIVATVPPALASLEFELKSNDDWKNIPSIMRVQLIRHETSFKLLEFDNALTNNFSKTLFLYPEVAGSLSASFTSDDRMRDSSAQLLKKAKCTTNFMNGGYACSIKIDLGFDVLVGDKGTYLNLAALYSKSNYQITLLDSANNVVNFDNVQPEIDSTGRANDVFRRVKSRVERSSSDAANIAPFAAVDVDDDFCKAYKFFADTGPSPKCD